MSKIVEVMVTRIMSVTTFVLCVGMGVLVTMFVIGAALVVAAANHVNVLPAMHHV